jgi:Flp pilus assembly pilin Flp
LYVYVQSLLAGRDQKGQASAEYALVLLGAAAVAVAVTAWAKQTGAVGKLLDAVFKQLLGRAT